ncbi:hypothetical protein AB0F91_21650 [Amycolatopsis sp. NPDC023774]|uniref:hypothetical protein n=1 Tax=Amycolatopsis sp. NPDC023774 TaxID=3155015 RepID=UPI0033C69895
MPTGSHGLHHEPPRTGDSLVAKALEGRPPIMSLPEGRAAELVTRVALAFPRLVADLAFPCSSPTWPPA